MRRPPMITITNTFTIQRLWLGFPKLVTAKDQKPTLVARQCEA